MYAPYRKGLRIKPLYTSSDGLYGELTPAQKRAVVGSAGVGIYVAIAGTWTFVVGPWAVKQFRPRWSYGKRLMTSFLAGTMMSLVKRAATPTTEINVTEA